MSRSIIARSFSAYSIVLAATALLLAVPSTARAGYPDGMNRYAGYHIMHGGVDPSGLARRIAKCTVVVALGHYNRAQKIKIEADPARCSALGILSCWADAVNNEVYETAAYWHEPAHWKGQGHYAPKGWDDPDDPLYASDPNPGLIPNFPKIKAPIGDGKANIYNRARAAGGLHRIPEVQRKVFDLTRDTDEWNGGRGPGAANFEALIQEAWDAAKAHATNLCKDDKCCRCGTIWVKFTCDKGVSSESSAVRDGGWCGKKVPVRCPK